MHVSQVQQQLQTKNHCLNHGWHINIAAAVAVRQVCHAIARLQHHKNFCKVAYNDVHFMTHTSRRCCCCYCCCCRCPWCWFIFLLRRHVSCRFAYQYSSAKKTDACLQIIICHLIIWIWCHGHSPFRSPSKLNSHAHFVEACQVCCCWWWWCHSCSPFHTCAVQQSRLNWRAVILLLLLQYGWWRDGRQSRQPFWLCLRCGKQVKNTFSHFLCKLIYHV